MPKVAGILNIVSGCFLGMAAFGSCMNVINAGQTEWAWGIIFIIPGILALIGGIYSLEKRSWKLALIGSIFAIPCVLGILSTILVSVSKEEFFSTKK
jgi:hypothetical protein